MPRYPDAKRSRVVLIGTSDFELPDKLPNLPGVRGNLSGLERAFTDPQRGVFDASACVVIDSPDTARSLTSRLSRAVEQAEDVLLVYYAGHGTLDANGALHLAVRGTDPDPYLVGASAVSFAMVRQLIENSQARLRLLILDCCFSGKAVGAMAADTAALNQIDVSGTFVLTSSEANRISRAMAGERYTAFTRELLALLEGRDDDTDLTLADLQRKLRAALAKADLPRPMSRADDTAGELVVRRARPSAQGRSAPVSKKLPKAMPRPVPTLLPKPLANRGQPWSTPPARPQSSTGYAPGVEPVPAAPTSAAVESVWRRVLRVPLTVSGQWVLFAFCALMTATGIGQVVSPPASDTSSLGADVAMLIVFAGLTVWLGWRLLRHYLRKRAARQAVQS